MRKKYFDCIVTLALMTGCLFYFYGNILLHPNEHLTVDGGDGIKAFAVFAGHIKNDTDYTNYRNMNYPYGQTHIYTDGQTAFANIIKFLSGYNSFFLHNSIGIYNLLMILSYACCAFFLLLILNRLGLPSWYKIAATICITLLSPQLFRLMGHPTLSYVVFFPLSWWLLIRFRESRKKMWWAGLMIINSTFWFFVHPYYVMLSGLFYLFFWIIYFLQTRKKSTVNKSEILTGLLAAVLPIILTRLYISWADTHVFRSEFPYGFWVYYASFYTVFMSYEPPLDHLFKTLFSLDKHMNFEGYAYIGFVAVMVAVFTVFRFFRYSLKLKFRLIGTPVLPGVLRPAIWASIIVLAFSFCYPFRIGFAFLLDWFSFLKQFRSLGRFAWCFYYVFTVYAVYMLWLFTRYLRMKKLVLLSNTILFFSIGLYFIEGFTIQKIIGTAASRAPNLFNFRQVPADYRQMIDRINAIKGDYQCIVPLPFYNVGNENFETVVNDVSIRSSLVISHWTNMPLLSNSAARSPIMEGKNIMQFFSPPSFSKSIEKDLPSKKPFLVLYTRDSLKPQEKYFFSRSEKILENKSFILFSLPYEAVFNSNAEEEINRFNMVRNSLKEINGFLADSSIEFIYAENFENNPVEHAYRGNGAKSGMRDNILMLAEKIKLPLDTSKEYIASFWHYNAGEMRNQGQAIVEENLADGNNDWSNSLSPAGSMVIDGDWSMLEIRFRPQKMNGIISLLLTETLPPGQLSFDDELLIRPADKDVYKIVAMDEKGNATVILKNNILLNK